MRFYKKFSVNKKMSCISLAVIIPMSILIMYLLWALSDSKNAYLDINRNVAYANQYVKDFKERMDYTIYSAIISNTRFDEIGNGNVEKNGIVTVNPYSYIEELRNVCDKLASMATVDSNRSEISRIKRTLGSLEMSVSYIDNNIIEGGKYDNSMEILHNDIHGLTTMIQKGISDYIYVETTNFVHVRSELDHKYSRIVFVSIVTFVIIVLISSHLSFIAARSVTEPIKKLCSLTDKVAQGDFSIRSNLDSEDEMAVLARNFDEMTTELGMLVENIEQNHIKIRKIEGRLLQEQINPHFLYNTLDTIVWLAEAGKKKEVIAMVTYLSDFFRTTLSGGSDIISIKDEERHVESYLKIQKFRYQDVLDYKIDFESLIYDYTIPKLMIQPLVENALSHGIRNKRGKGVITVIGRKKGDYIEFEVQDNGKGMSEEELNRLRKRLIRNDTNIVENSGFGLVNVNERIGYYYGEGCGLFIESVLGEGTIARIRIKAKNI